MFRIALICAAVIVAAWHLATPVYAYLDPGTGNALLQGIIGGLAVATGFVAYQWQRVRHFFSFRRGVDARKDQSGE
jgi:uncharacterized membrane protein